MLFAPFRDKRQYRRRPRPRETQGPVSPTRPSSPFSTPRPVGERKAMNDTNKQHQQALDELREVIKDVKVAMLVTETADGSLRSRPMATQQTEFDGDLWFFTDLDSAKVFEIESERHVNVSYADPSHDKYASVSGLASLFNDRSKIRELWNAHAKAWFPGGPDDANVALIRVRPTAAEYWDTPSGTLIDIAGFVKAVTSGERLDKPGKHEKVSM